MSVSYRSRSSALIAGLDPLLLDFRRLSDAVAQVVELGPPAVAAGGDLGLRDGALVGGLVGGGRVVGGERVRGGEVGGPFEGAAQRLGVAPAGDPGVVAGAQNGRDGPPAELGGAGVLGRFEEASG